MKGERREGDGGEEEGGGSREGNGGGGRRVNILVVAVKIMTEKIFCGIKLLVAAVERCAKRIVPCVLPTGWPQHLGHQ